MDPRKLNVLFITRNGFKRHSTVYGLKDKSGGVINLSVSNWGKLSYLWPEGTILEPATPVADDSLWKGDNPPLALKGNKTRFRFSVIPNAAKDRRAYYFKGLLVAVTTSGKKGKGATRTFFIRPGSRKDVFVECDENGDECVNFCYWRVGTEIGGGVWDKTRTFFPITSEGIPLSPTYNPKSDRQRVKLIYRRNRIEKIKRGGVWVSI